MLKALDDLEKAVSRMMERARTGARERPETKDDKPIIGKVKMDQTGRHAEQSNEEAGEFIRRAIKRLKSL